MNLTAIINTPVTRMSATLDPATISQAKLNLYELAQQRGFTGTFEDFLSSIVETESKVNRYTHTQFIPQPQWIINHNLGVQPQITVLSMGGMIMLAEILHTSTNQAIIYFDNPTAGIANCI